jgi:ABC-type nickel/cobalt efflux system permease component RcnA
MAQNHIELIGIVLLLVFAATMFYHGTMILFQHRGYSQNNYKKDSANMRRRIEELLREDERD